jgi:hypothetical protein
MSDNEDESDGNEGDVPNASPTAHVAILLDVIWDDDKIEKYTDNNGKNQWKCLWCGQSYKQWNATKALYHVNKETGGDIRVCKSTKIDEAHKAAYRRLFNKLIERQNSQTHLKQGKKRASDEYMDTATERYTAMKRKKTPPSTTTRSDSISPASNLPSNQIQTQLNFSAEPIQENPTLDTHRSYQPKVTDSIEVQADGRLTMAIADLIHSCGLPFSLASHHKFHRVLTCAKQAPKNYTPPNRNIIAGKLLDINYNIYQNKTTEKLLKDAEIYGLTFFGDGATIRKSPLINILASSVHEPAGCLSIVDCTGHMESDGRKDASYIASLFVPHIKVMEQKVPKSTDLVIFDGASNVQKAGSLIEAQFPHVSVIHGAEHVISLFYSDVFRIKEYDVLKLLNQSIYRYFGSGSMHSFYAMFSKHSRDHNQGKSIGLIRASDTRMGGHVISMMRTLRLKLPLINTLSSASFVQGNFKIDKKLIELLKSDSTWQIMTKLVRAIFPLLIVLRLSDEQEPCMDKLYFYVRRMDSTLLKSKEILDEVEKKFSGSSWRTLFDTITIDDDESSSNESEYDTETCDEDDSDTKTTLGQKVIDIWKKRRDKLINDFSIAGWLLSPIPDVYNDSRENSNGQHRNAIDRLLKKMFASQFSDDSDELANLLNDFWEEFEHFISQTGPFEKAYIWKYNNPDLHHGRSHLWHKKNSVPFTKVLGKFACRVCSKIVGMGSAERNWGAVKHLKTDKRSHLSSDAVQKQATIFGATCMLNARLERNAKKGTLEDPYKFWNDEDFDNEFSLSEKTHDRTEDDNIRVFKGYLEDWEKAHLFQKDDVSRAKFLQKYGGLEFDDVDLPVHYWIAKDELHFQRKTKYEDGGWCILATSDEYEVDDEGQPKLHKWSIFDGCALIDCIASYYLHNPQDNLKLVLRKGQENEIRSLAACGGCGERATPHHKCDKCTKNMHVECGRTIGVVDDRSPVRCPTCDSKGKHAKKDADDSRSRNGDCTPRKKGKDDTNSTNDDTRAKKKDSTLSRCGGCGGEVGPVHKCDICKRNMHVFCGRTIGEEGYGAPVRCPKCDNKS